MKSNPHWLTIISAALLIFCVTYLVTKFICKKLYIDAALIIAVPLLFRLLVYAIKNGK